MRLLHSKTRQMKEFIGDENVPPYAILSHTWGDDEVTHQGFLDPNPERKVGYVKIQYCCDQAVQDGLDWVWMDTCCIDKSSSAELSEAINSMFRWYKNAVVCYAYLSDVSGAVDPALDSSEFEKSRWFTRGWTLQELIAPKRVVFYSKDWKKIGMKAELSQSICEITGIDLPVLRGRHLENFNVARKMSWAAKRVTTRIEDIAYSLLGIFDVNMPLLYGEGKKAFFRLQEEIIKAANDHSLFAWGFNSRIKTLSSFLENDYSQSPSLDRPLLRGLLAESPVEFADCKDICSFLYWAGNHGDPTIVYNKAVRINIPLLTFKEVLWSFAVLGCRTINDKGDQLAVALRTWGYGCYFGRKELVLIPRSVPLLNDSKLISGPMKTIQVKQEIKGWNSLQRF